MHVKAQAEETFRAVNANVTLKLQSVFKKRRMKKKMSRREEEEEKGSICLLILGKRISFVSLYQLV